MSFRMYPLSLLAAAQLLGCSGVEPLGTGTLALEWEVSPNGCASAGVEVVEVRLNGPHAAVERFACSRGGAELADITPGDYRLTLHGFDANGEEIFVSEPAEARVESDVATTPPPLRLLASPATVQVGWLFENGRVCGANGVRWISIAAFDEYDYEVATAQFSCDDGVGEITTLRAGAYLLEVSALDAERARWRGTQPIKVGRGEALSVDVELAPLEESM